MLIKKLTIKPPTKALNPLEQIERTRLKVEALTYAYEKAKEDMNVALLELTELEKLHEGLLRSQSSNTTPSRHKPMVKRILLPSERPIVFDVSDSLAYWLFGPSFAQMVYVISRSRLFRMYGNLGLFMDLLSYLSAIDILSKYISLTMIYAIPYIFIMLFSLNRYLCTRLMRTFEVWYLYVYCLIVMMSCCLIMRPHQAIYALTLIMYIMVMFVLMDALPMGHKFKLYICLYSFFNVIKALATLYFNWVHVEDAVYQWDGVTVSCLSLAMNGVVNIGMFMIRNIITHVRYPNHMVILKSRLKKSSYTHTSTSVASIDINTSFVNA